MNYRGETMELGEKILRARQEAGLSQRQLCGDTITRNMLSQIEHGTARPSMGTLKILAARLGKPVSYFLDEDLADTAAIAQGWMLLQQAEEAIAQEKFIYAQELLKKAGVSSPEMQRKKCLLLSRLPGAKPEEICKVLPGLDEELLLRAKGALDMGRLDRCLHLLDAMEDPESPEGQFLRGEVYLARQDYTQAAEAFHAAEGYEPSKTAPKLEICYRELGDFQKAYIYACKQKVKMG